MIIECILLATSLCHAIKDKPVIALAGVEAGLAISDGATTGHIELDPLTQPFIGVHPTWSRMIPVGAVEVVASMWFAERMKRSHNWTRHIWWLPQSLAITSHSAGLVWNITR